MFSTNVKQFCWFQSCKTQFLTNKVTRYLKSSAYTTCRFSVITGGEEKRGPFNDHSADLTSVNQLFHMLLISLPCVACPQTKQVFSIFFCRDQVESWICILFVLMESKGTGVHLCLLHPAQTLILKKRLLLTFWLASLLNKIYSLFISLLSDNKKLLHTALLNHWFH